MQYHNGIILKKYIETHNLTIKQKYSILLQICNIITLLYKGGYLHGDLHAENIMVTPTTKKYFIFQKKKIPHYGIQLSAIDYGYVMHKKFKKYSGIKRHFSLMSELFYNCLFKLHILKHEKLENNCDKLNKKLPWFININFEDNGIKKIFINYPQFFIKYFNEYLQIFPKAKKLKNSVLPLIKNSNNLSSLYVENDNDLYFMFILERINIRFALEYPKEYMKLFGWCSEPEFILPKKDVIEIMKLNTPNKMINYFISRIFQ
jgi:hypothetical protein